MILGKRPDNLGVRDGKLAPCKYAKLCAKSDAEHSIEPLTYNSTPRGYGGSENCDP